MNIRSVKFLNTCDLRLSSNWLVSDCPPDNHNCAQDPPSLDNSFYIFWPHMIGPFLTVK